MKCSLHVLGFEGQQGSGHSQITHPRAFEPENHLDMFSQQARTGDKDIALEPA